MTNMIADFLVENGVAQMKRKGHIQEGTDADITIFDADTVADRSTIPDGGLPSAGIPRVIVNGTIVVRVSVNVDDVFPGPPVRVI